MNKAELISHVANYAKISKKAAAAAVDAFVDAVKQTLKKGSELRLVGFGTFGVKKRKARKGRNPKTGAEIQIPAQKVPFFRPSSELKNLLKK
ncbi:MAG: HU family DNA-binding protein [Candidatus Hydrothermales bacterium]